jgi:hypothetical protein
MGSETEGRIIDGNYTGRYYGLLISFLSEVIWQIHRGSEHSILGMQVDVACTAVSST